MSTFNSARQERHQPLELDLEARVSALEDDIRTLTAAAEAASRLRISTRRRVNHDIRIAGGKAVRRILERGGLVRGYPEAAGRE
jgi:hypothetical protein